MAGPPIRLKYLLRDRHWQTYRTFCLEYDKAAEAIDPVLKGTWPSRTQLHRWLSGDLKGLPYPDHCRILEAMLPGWSAAQMFEPHPGGRPGGPVPSADVDRLFEMMAVGLTAPDSVPGHCRLPADAGTGLPPSRYLGNSVNGRTVEGENEVLDKPDVAALARSQIAAARRRLGLTTKEFAEVLTPLLGWAPSSGVVETWEGSATPPGDVLVAATLVIQAAPLGPVDRDDDDDLLHPLPGQRFADVEAVFATRSEFMSRLPPHELFGGASRIDAAGLSLNSLCQQYPDDQLRHRIEQGTALRCLFLAPHGTFIEAREREEDYPPGALSALTEMNLQILSHRVRERLSDEHRPRVQIATYDETIRFNIILVDQQVAVVQPYLPAERGVESPTFLIRRQPSGAGLFSVFEQTFAWLWERSTPI